MRMAPLLGVRVAFRAMLRDSGFARAVRARTWPSTGPQSGCSFPISAVLLLTYERWPGFVVTEEACAADKLTAQGT